MTQFSAPPVPDLARAFGQTRDEMVNWLIAYYSIDGAPFNYVSGTRCVKTAYKGLHNIEQLIAGTKAERLEQGRKSNGEIVSLAAPLAFGRKMQVFDLPRRSFYFGRDLSAGYRIPFFFVENKTVKLYYLQPRKKYNLTFRQMSMVATIHKKHLLDTEFYGQSSDIEYVDLSADSTGSRKVNTYKMSDLDLWSDKDLSDHLTLIAESIEYIKNSALLDASKKRRRIQHVDMPLFD